MASEFDDTDFVDCDFKTAQQSAHPSSMTVASESAPVSSPKKLPSCDELDEKATMAQQKITELKRAKEVLERERSELEENRRRRLELQTGREEMLHHLTRGIGLLDEAEFAARRDAEQMAKSLVELREALENVKAVQEESWTTDNWNIELTTALTAVENARMEWNSARLKWTVLNPAAGDESAGIHGMTSERGGLEWLESRGFRGWCRIGLALTWPVAASVLAAAALILAFLWNP